MRIRTVKPEFFKHHDLFQAEKETGFPLRLAFEGLWCCSDREGRFKWKPTELKMDILPYDDVDFTRVLDALWTREYLVKYTSNHKVYGWIPSFLDHQAINNRETASVLPSPKESVILTRESRVCDACGTPLNSDQGEGKGKEGKGREGKVLAATHASQPGLIPDPEPDIPEQPSAEKLDLAYEVFAEKFFSYRNIPYGRSTGDFVQLSKLRKQLQLGTKDIPGHWENAIDNYFQTPQGKYTLADLCVRYDVFLVGPLDRYGKPAGVNETHQANVQTARQLEKAGFFDSDS